MVLLERQAELTAVTEALRAARTGNGNLVAITGPLGIGKTTLLHHLPELVDLAEPSTPGAPSGTRVLRASGALLEQDFAFGVVRQLFELVVPRAPEPVRQRWLARAASFAQLVFSEDNLRCADHGPDSVAQTVLHGLQSLVANMSAEQPLLILVDDLQWVDVPSLRWLAYLAKRLDGLAVTVVVTVREGELRASQPLVREVTAAAARTLRPRPLSLAATRVLVAEQFGEPGDEEFVSACHQTSDGNPVFLMSMLLSMAISGRRPVTAEAEHARALRPSLLRDRLISCMRGQPVPVREFARALALLGEQADLELVCRLAGLDPVGGTEALRVLDQLGLLATDAPLRFAHATMQDAVEESMTVAEREQLHLRAATLLHGCGHPAEQVAAQLLAVTAQQDHWAIEVLRSAADTALRRGAPEVAARYLRRALLDCSPDGEDRAALLVDLATAERGFDPQASVRHISQAVPLFSSARQRAAAVTRIAPAVLDAAPLPVLDVVWQVAQELGDADQLTGPERELALRLEAQLRYTDRGDPARLRSGVDRLRALGAEPPVSTAAERQLTTVLLHAAMLSQHLPADVVARLAGAVLEREPATPGHVHTALPLLVPTLVAADAVQGISSWLDIALDQARSQHAVGAQVWICVEQAMTLLGTGELGRAKALALEAFELAGAQWADAAAMSAVALAWVAVQTRDTDLARWLLGEGEQGRFGATGADRHTPCVTAVQQMLRGWLATVAGEHARALEHFLDCGHWVERAGWRNPALYPWRSWAAAAHRRLGNLDAAHELLDEEDTLLTEWSAPAARGRLLRERARLACGARSVELLRQAVSTLEASDNRLELARASVSLGRLLHRAGDSQGDNHLRRGYQLATRCGVSWLAEQARTELASAGAAGLPRPRPAAVGPVLTKTEHRVASLAVHGHTNKEIADALAVTCRAVEKHLTNAYRKLAVPGRAGLAGALRALSAGTETTVGTAPRHGEFRY